MGKGAPGDNGNLPRAPRGEVRNRRCGLPDVIRVDAIPVLGTGKTDYKVLRKMVIERVEGKAK